MSDFIEMTRAFCAASKYFRGSVAALFVLLALVCGADAQKKAKQQPNSIERSAPTAASLSSTLTAAFPDANGDGKAAPGETVTYTATVTNSGTSAATNVVYTNTVDQNSAYVANSASVSSAALDGSLVYCTFYPNSGGFASGGTDGTTGDYNSTDDNFNMIFGGQNQYVNFITSSPGYNAGAGIFRFYGSLQNLLPNALGTLDGSTLDANGVQMIVQKITVNSGSGTVTAIDPASFRFDQIIAQDQITNPSAFQFNVPNTVTSFTVGFLVSTKVQLKLVINEVLTNPGGTITDANGEWFELYNAGRFPVNLQNFLINDASAAASPGEECYDTNKCYRPPFTVATSLRITPGSYMVFGNTTNTTNNGGVPVDYAYGAAMALANSLDAIRIRTPAATGALTIDRTQYATASVSAQNGISRELKNPALDNQNMDGSNWGDAGVTSVYGAGGRGTPKAQNSFYTPFWSGDKIMPEKSGAIFVAGASSKNDSLRVAPLAGETVSANLGTIPAGESVVVTYQVKIADPLPAGTTQISTQGTISGDNFASVATDDPATASTNDPTATPVQTFAPTAAPVNIGGRVTEATGRGIFRALVTLIDSQGVEQTAYTNPQGYYSFADVPSGQTYIFSVRHLRYGFAAPSLVEFVVEDNPNINFVSSGETLLRPANRLRDQ